MTSRNKPVGQSTFFRQGLFKSLGFLVHLPVPNLHAEWWQTVRSSIELCPRLLILIARCQEIVSQMLRTLGLLSLKDSGFSSTKWAILFVEAWICTWFTCQWTKHAEISNLVLQNLYNHAKITERTIHDLVHRFDNRFLFEQTNGI